MEMEIDNNLIEKLLDLLEDKLEGYTLLAQNFIIQYGYFELENNHWLFKTFLDIGNESIKNIYLQIDEKITNFKVFAQNPKFGVLHITKKMDMINKSRPEKIYACDLYQDFEPEHYVGKCCTGILG